MIDNPEALPVFTIENVVDYLITSNNMRAEDWKSFKTGGYKRPCTEDHDQPRRLWYVQSVAVVCQG